MNKRFLIWVLFLTFSLCNAQNRNVKLVGGSCEGCEAIFEYQDKVLSSIDTLPLFNDNTPKLKLSGIVFEKDGITPAKNVIIYIYQTNRRGIYQTKGNEKGWARRHGFIRGWVKTNAKGEYTFFTFRPGAYPNRRAPEHIHVTIKEPSKNAYYIDDFMFEDDPLLSNSIRDELNNRGGSGIVLPKKNGQVHDVSRNLILGLNIPNYN